MKISTINNYTNTRYNKTSFKSHPDFKRLAETHNVLASSFFRRGPYYGSPCEEFKSIIELFSKIFSPKNKQKMLIAGIGNSQEPFSYLAVIKSLFNDKKIDDLVELHTIDLQSKPETKELFKHSYFEYNYMPEYASSSFIKDVKENMKYDSVTGYYRVNDEIFNYLNKTYNKNSLWETRVQEAVKNINSNEFDLISANNIIGYIIDKTSRIETLNNMCRVLKQGGALITDTYNDFIKEADLIDKLDETAEGIYIKK